MQQKSEKDFGSKKLWIRSLTLRGIPCSKPPVKTFTTTTMQCASLPVLTVHKKNKIAYLTEENGEGVLAADVCPKMELEELFPKSDCPPELPNMPPLRGEVPKPPVP